MDPILSYSGLELSLVELILGAALLLLGALIALMFSRGGSKKLENHIQKMGDQQTLLQGRLTQMAQDSAQRDEQFRDSLDNRLSNVSDRVGKSILETQERNSESMKQLHERLALSLIHI